MAMSRKGPGNLLEVFCYDYGPGKRKCRKKAQAVKGVRVLGVCHRTERSLTT